MSVQLKDRANEPALPTDITLRAPIYRRQGIIASLVASLAGLAANRRLKQLSRRYRTAGLPPVPDYLREDIGLPPLPPPITQWWEPKL